MNKSIHRWGGLGIVILACIFVVSCNSQIASSMRKMTYPPDFTYTEQSELRSDMAKLAQQMVLLEEALAITPSALDNTQEIQRQKVLLTLRNIGRIAANLRANDSGANHPYMQDYMQEFISKIDAARVAASIATPRYYYAGKIAGGCTNCHKVNR